MNAFYVYILQRSDGPYYVGSAQNVAERVRTHNEGGGTAYVFRRRPVGLVYAEKHPSKAPSLRSGFAHDRSRRESSPL